VKPQHYNRVEKRIHKRRSLSSLHDKIDFQFFCFARKVLVGHCFALMRAVAVSSELQLISSVCVAPAHSGSFYLFFFFFLLGFFFFAVAVCAGLGTPVSNDLGAKFDVERELAKLGTVLSKNVQNIETLPAAIDVRKDVMDTFAKVFDISEIRAKVREEMHANELSEEKHTQKVQHAAHREEKKLIQMHNEATGRKAVVPGGGMDQDVRGGFMARLGQLKNKRAEHLIDTSTPTTATPVHQVFASPVVTPAVVPGKYVGGTYRRSNIGPAAQFHAPHNQMKAGGFVGARHYPSPQQARRNIPPRVAAATAAAATTMQANHQMQANFVQHAYAPAFPDSIPSGEAPVHQWAFRR
jgi:hypothetical protein